MTEIELLEAVLENRKAGRNAGAGLLHAGKPSAAEIAYAIQWQSPENYTRAPRTRVINGFTVPAPLMVAPADGAVVWAERADGEYYADVGSFVSGGTYWGRAFARGLLHMTKEAAAANCKARLGIDPKWGGE